MKPFDLKEYFKNPSRKVVTRDGRNVRIICTDAIGSFPIVALVRRYDSTMDTPYQYTKDGRYFNLDETHGLDLFFASEKKEGWINLYENECGTSWLSPCYFTSKKAAEEEGKNYTCNVTTIKIEWEE